MNRNLHSPTKLTEFARDFDDEPETIFSKLVNKFTSAYNSNYNNLSVINPSSSSPSQSTSASTITINQDAQTSNCLLPEIRDDSTSSLNNLVQSDSSEAKNDSSRSSSKENSPVNQSVGEPTQNSVMHRISNLIALRSNVSF